MNSIELKKELDLLKGKVLQECRQALESIASERYPVEMGYKQIVLIFPIYDPDLPTPIYVNSCFQGEDTVLIRKINCSSEGLSVRCQYVGEGHTWRANIADVCMHERDMIDILELIESMRSTGNVYEHLHVKL